MTLRRLLSKKYNRVMRLLALLVAAAVLPSFAQTLTADQDKTFGNPSAPVRLDIFSDFQCPACRVFHTAMLPRIFTDYGVPGKIYIVSHEYPLIRPDHKYSREVANYATAAARVGKYVPVTDALFQNQATWESSGKYWDTIASVLTPAEQKKVQTLAKDPAVIAEVQADLNLGNQLQVQSTPSIFITGPNGKHYALPWPMTYSLFQSMVTSLAK
jgi:protein-disulfide isomerase